LHATTISMYESDLKDIILEATQSNLHYKEIVTKLQQGILQQKLEDYKLGDNEVLMYRGRIYVPDS
jgi:hypothetical protein